MIGLNHIVSPGDNFAILYNYRTNRNFTQFSGFGSLFKGLKHILLILSCCMNCIKNHS